MNRASSPAGKHGITRFVNGRIAEEWVEFDGLRLLQQLGVVPQMT